MIKLAKYIVLVAGLAGLAGFFLPFVVVGEPPDQESFTALTIVKGVDLAEQVMDTTQARSLMSPAERAEALDVLQDFKGIVIGVFIPSAVLALFGVIGVFRGRFGRGFGIGSVLFGGLAIAIWVALRMAMQEAEAERVPVAAAIAMHLLLASGVLGLLGGLSATVSPDRGR